jgi:hypothetical protein
MSPAAETLIRRLDGARQRWWLFTLLSTAVLAVCASLGLLLAFMLTDAWLIFSQLALTGMFLTWLVVTGGLILLVCRRLGRSHRSLEATARRVEWEFPELGSDLINVVQLATDQANENRQFCEAALADAASRAARIPLENAAAKVSRVGRFVHCMQTPRDLVESIVVLGLLIAAAVACQLLLPNWGSAASRLMAPWQFIPSVGSVGEIRVRPGDAEVLVGASQEISAEIANPQARVHKGSIYLRPEGEPESELPLVSDPKHAVYKIVLPAVVKNIAYRVQIGDSQSKIFKLTAREKPTFSEVQVTYRYPAYLGRVPETFMQPTADLEAPACTVAELNLRPSTPIAKAYLDLGGQRLLGSVESDAALAILRMPLLRDGSFRVVLETRDGHSDPDARLNRIHVLTDQPPTAEVLKPAAQSTSAPGAQVPVVVRARDDYGVGQVRLEMRIDRPASATEEKPRTVTEWTRFDGTTTVLVEHRLTLAADRIKNGDVVMIRARAWDRRNFGDWGQDLRPQESASAWHAIKIVAPEVKVAAALEQLDGIRAAVFKILEMQLRARGQARLMERAVRTEKELKAPSPPAPLPQADEGRQSGSPSPAGEGRQSGSPSPAGEERKSSSPTGEGSRSDSATLGEIRAAQVAIQKAAVAVVALIAEADSPERLRIKRTMNALSLGPMVEAVELCDKMANTLSRNLSPLTPNPSPARGEGSNETSSRAAEGLSVPLPRLAATQERIIAALRTLLDVARKAQAEALAEAPKRAAGDLPPDVKAKLEEARRKLEEFLKQQKKVIEASENLAKKPVEDFKQAEEEKLKAMAAAEDEWSRFMQDLHSDLSKLPEQDFANSTLAKELNEIQTELKMAADALTKKSADIAVPLEQLGYERAEELKTNMEKWLPDTPDREKWSQEESTSDKDKEAPMAELPGELEDMIGELMEQEEDLMSEAEDVSSSASDSLDKGAGWDAADGPISNNSAKGVTGNRLPNTSEIGGRAGEGRSGKSSGEFVGDEAVGKGGRKTPSRLTPDPYVAGQVKDHSRDPQGGASGGGKESGQGGEGLEGPAPSQPAPRDSARLAEKQAALRNKAEGVDLQFQVAGFHRTDMRKLVDLMAQVEKDLAGGRYQNVLRQRQTLLRTAGDIKQYLKGEFKVRKDVSANLPADIQRDILGAAGDASPAGWEEINREYFERLMTSEKKPVPATKP